MISLDQCPRLGLVQGADLRAAHRADLRVWLQGALKTVAWDCLCSSSYGASAKQPRSRHSEATAEMRPYPKALPVHANSTGSGILSLRLLWRVIKLSALLEGSLLLTPGVFAYDSPAPGPACLVLDVLLPGLDGLGLQRQLVERGRMEQIVFITGHGDIPMGIQAMKRGAIDFLPKPFEDEMLLSAVAQALGRSAENWRRHGQVAQIRARMATLTPREFEVFRLVIAGLLNKQIAAELGAALRTIKTHRGRVMRKLRANSVAELVRLAQSVGVAPALPGPKGP